ERCIAGEIIGERDEDGNRISTIDFGGIYYEPPYLKTARVDAVRAATSEGMYDGINMDSSGNVAYVLTEIRGVDRDDRTLYLNINEGETAVSINGYLESLDGREYDVYANLGSEQWVECDYQYLHEMSIESGMKQFSINVQRRYLMEETITLVAVAQDTHEAYLLDDLEVRYSE
ncbi:MAG TPA: hypothetical protein DIS78_08275, partial [Lachnospiraceae bacterium]|nr:hypothetical protein [Lachnospiraceae bacterium]